MRFVEVLEPLVAWYVPALLSLDKRSKECENPVSTVATTNVKIESFFENARRALQKYIQLYPKFPDIESL